MGAEVCGWAPYSIIFRQVPSAFWLNFSALSYVCLGRSKKGLGILVVGMYFGTGSPKSERFVNPFCFVVFNKQWWMLASKNKYLIIFYQVTVASADFPIKRFPIPSPSLQRVPTNLNGTLENLSCYRGWGIVEMTQAFETTGLSFNTRSACFSMTVGNFFNLSCLGFLVNKLEKRIYQCHRVIAEMVCYLAQVYGQ